MRILQSPTYTDTHAHSRIQAPKPEARAHTHFVIRRLLYDSRISILSSLTSVRYRAQAHLFVGE